MPKIESKSHKQSLKFLPISLEKDVFNPFPDIYESSYCAHKTKKQSPKIAKKNGKCFQLILICQKLLKPFSSTYKTSETSSKKLNCNYKEKSKSTPHINIDDRLKIHKPIFPIQKVDVSIQTNIQSIAEGIPPSLNTSSNHFSDGDYFVKENEIHNQTDYWDLDIDSAIVGDYNSVSEVSLDDQIDPHYATIKMNSDGKSIEKFEYINDESILNRSLKDQINSNTSSPKSGIYSKINKVKVKDQPMKFKLPSHNYMFSRSNPKLNFSQIMMIKNHLGLTPEMYHFDSGSKSSFPSEEFIFYPSFVNTNVTPDLPKRNYGSSIVNFITKLREEKISSNHSFKNSVVNESCLTTNSDDITRINDIYSPIWYTKRKANEKKMHKLENTPASEPIMPKRSTKTILNHLNPVFKDDSSEDASSILFYSPLKNKNSYPKLFSEYSALRNRLDEENLYDIPNDEETICGEMGMFRHVDSEVDVSIFNNNLESENCVPLDLKHTDFCFAPEDKLFLEPLMERSYEEDYFLKDITSSLDYINV